VNILILGGNRFSGKLVTEKLYNQGHNVTVLNRRGTAPVPCKIIRGDRNDENWLKSALQNESFDCIIDMCLYNLEQARKSMPIFENKTHRYVFISSIAAYQKSNVFPIAESNPMGPWPLHGNYGIEKSKIEHYLSSFKDLSYVVLRPTYVIGKDNHHNREGYYFDKILNNEPVDIEGDGQAILSFIFVEDLANVITIFATSNNTTKETYNVCNDEFITIRGFVELVSTITGKSATLSVVDEMVSFKNEHCFFSNEKVKKHLDYKFKTLEQGLTELYEYAYKIS